MDELAHPNLRRAVASFFDTLTKRKKEAWIALFAEDSTCHSPVGAPAAQGPAELGEMWSVLVGPFESLEIQPDETFYAPNSGAVKWSAEGRGLTGNTVEFEGIVVLELDSEGKIQTAMNYWDPGDVLIRMAGEIDLDAV